jgi:hypothetical protein
VIDPTIDLGKCLETQQVALCAGKSVDNHPSRPRSCALHGPEGFAPRGRAKPVSQRLQRCRDKTKRLVNFKLFRAVTAARWRCGSGRRPTSRRRRPAPRTRRNRQPSWRSRASADRGDRRALQRPTPGGSALGLPKAAGVAKRPNRTPQKIADGRRDTETILASSKFLTSQQSRLANRATWVAPHNNGVPVSRAI